MLVLLGGCGATLEQLQARAAFDLGCPKEQLSVVELDGQTRGVTGCGKKATYVESCRSAMNGAPVDCTWVLNSPQQQTAPASAQK